MTEIEKSLRDQIAKLQTYIDNHEKLIQNAPKTIMDMQAKLDRYDAAVMDLCNIVDPTVNQLIEAGFDISITVPD